MRMYEGGGVGNELRALQVRNVYIGTITIILQGK
jgi:hypothetical protein